MAQPPGNHQYRKQGRPTGNIPMISRPGSGYGIQPPPPPPPMATIPPHPSGWTQHPGPTGQPYYYNTFTRQSTWKRPPELDQPLPMRMPPPPPSTRPATTMTMSGPPTTNTTTNTGMDKTNKSQSSKEKKKDKAKRMTLIPGTHWKLVKTAEGREFYYDTETKKSVWTIPEEIVDAVNALKTVEQESNKRKAEEMIANDTAKPIDETVSTASSYEDKAEESTKRIRAESIETGIQVDTATKSPEMATEMTEEDILFQLQAMQQEEEQQYQQQTQIPSIAPEAALSYEERVVLFKTLLEESNVSAFSLWEKELPKIAADPRYLLIPSVKQRKEIFDDYCKHLVNKPKGAVVGRKKTAKEKYQGLLEQQVTETTRWLDFSHKHKRDSRFNAVDTKERMRLFDNYVKALKEDKQQIKDSEGNKVKDDYRQLLREMRRIDSESSWRSVKRMIEDDARYHAVGSADDQEDWFYEYRRELEKHEEERRQKREKEEKERERRRKEEASLRERERQVRRERAQRDREAKNQRAVVDKEDATRSCQTLFIDKIRDHTMTWSEAQPELHQDKRFELCAEMLGLREMETLYEVHIDTIYNAREKTFFALLDEQVPLSVSNWVEASEIVGEQKATTQLKLTDSKLADLFTRYHTKRMMKAKQDLNALLEESTFIEFHARDGTLAIKDVMEVLQEDQRYLQLAFIAEERDQIVERYVEDLMAKVGRKPEEKTSDADDDDDNEVDADA
ncbi:hypothetical protein BDF19DRAFT_465138 [Syncephalis fuscata]|nr:hypothetical protein BDF19DRAFT_465138 [Syncephalis fuscata]